jgi:acetylornithine deacetylase/succinyl-diaminopimelate desuccinylase-like protein
MIFLSTPYPVGELLSFKSLNEFFTKILGVPAFGTPYANPDERNHAPNENLEVERFIKGIKTGAALLVALGEM